jgi:uncharacterized protein (TIGR03435 family)
MLADRLKLAIHRENNVIPTYGLTVGRKSPKFKPSEAITLAAIEIGRNDRQAFVRLQDSKEKDRAVFALDDEGRTEFRTLDGTGTVIRQMTLSAPEK